MLEESSSDGIILGSVGDTVRDIILRKQTVRSDSLNQCSLFAFNAWGYFLQRCDNHGRFDARPRVVRVDMYPLRTDVTDEMVASMMDEYEEHGQIRRWKLNGKMFGEVLSYQFHNDTRYKAKASIYLKPDELGEQKESDSAKKLPVDVRQAIEDAYPGRTKVEHFRKVYGWLYGSQKHSVREVLDAIEASRSKNEPLAYAAKLLRGAKSTEATKPQDCAVPIIPRLPRRGE